MLSPSFFEKEWPQKELDGLAALSRERGILPVWLDVTKEDIVRFSPTLADIVAVKASNGLKAVINGLLKAMSKSPETESTQVARINTAQAFQFTKQEIDLLVTAAANDGELYLIEPPDQMAIGCVRVWSRVFDDESDSAVAAQYIDALESLITDGYVRHQEGILYNLTGLGFKVAREIANQTGDDKKK